MSATGAELAFLSAALEAPRIKAVSGRLAERARDEGWDYEAYLAAVLAEEVSSRDSHGGAARVKAARLVESRLERWIRTSGLEPGSRLPAERELARSLGVSRSTVREALHAQWLKGLVERRQGAGTFVVGGDPAPAFIGRVYGRPGPEARWLIRILDYRAAIEPPIASRAAERAGPHNVAQMRDILVDTEVETSPSRLAELDAAFHEAVAHATANPLLVQLVDFSAAWLASSRVSALQGRRRREQSLASHRAVLDAIVAHDPAAAAAAMADHIREVSEFVETRLKAGGQERRA